MDAWRSAVLGELPLEIIDGDRSSKYPKGSDIQDSGVLFLNTKNIVDDRLDLTDSAFVSHAKFSEIKKGRVQRNDILLTTRGSIGKVAFFNCEHATALINAQMLILRADGRHLDPKFLFYLLRGPQFRGAVINFASGAAQPQIPIMDLQEIKVLVPSIVIQRRIGSILSAYDDLIENNLRRIKILEEMASSVYREWFVNLQFPGSSQSSWTDSIPNGWMSWKVREILQRRRAGCVYREADVTAEGIVQVVDQSTRELLGFHNDKPDHVATAQKPIAIFGDHTCKMQLMVEPFSVGPNVVVFDAEIDRPIGYLFFLVRSLIHTQEYKRHWTELSAKEVLVADRAWANQFSEDVRPGLQLSENLRARNRVLRRLRDLLLPRLLSGVDHITGIAP